MLLVRLSALNELYTGPRQARGFCVIMYLMKINKLEQPQTTFFFERPDGTTYATHEAEAWGVYSGKNQMLGFRVPRHKLIGTSDGRKMYQAIVEAHQMVNEPEKAQERIRKGYDEELEVARATPRAPRNMDTIGRDGRPARIETLR